MEGKDDMNNETSSTIGALTFGVKSSEGQRPNQEDRWEARAFETADGQTAVLALVADGIGGGKAGEMASYLAKETVRDYVLAQRPTTSAIPSTLVRAFEEANQRIYAEAEKDPSLAGMGTTCTAVVVVGYRLYLAHVGDTRAYLVRGSGITQLSVDHTWAEEALRAGRSEEEIRQHPNRHVIKRYLGIDLAMKVDTHYRPFGDEGQELVDSVKEPLFLQDGDTLLLCSDGLTDVLGDPQILSVLRGRRAPQAASALVEQALKVPLPPDKKKDNITALVFNLPGWRKGGLALSRLLPAAGAVALILAAVGVAAFLLAQENCNGEITPTPTMTKATGQVTETTTVPPQATKSATATRTASHTPTPPTATLTATPTLEPSTVTPVVFTPTVPPTATPTRPPVTNTPTIEKGRELVLLGPGCGEGGEWVKGDTAPLKWTFDRSLKETEYFEVRIWPKGSNPDQAIKIPNIKEAHYSWNIAGYGYTLVQYEWQVVLMRRTLSKPAAESLVCWFQAVRKDEPTPTWTLKP